MADDKHVALLKQGVAAWNAWRDENPHVHPNLSETDLSGAIFDQAMQSVAMTADPQTEAAVHIVAWLSHGAVRPTGDDFAMLRLILLALLPQVGGVLLMVGRVHRGS